MVEFEGNSDVLKRLEDAASPRLSEVNTVENAPLSDAGQRSITVKLQH
jgi:hypothetical protein